jgi:predicted DNA-binding transcriptional regulator AlpA
LFFGTRRAHLDRGARRVVKTTSTASPRIPDADPLVPDPDVAREFSVSLKTIWEWTTKRPDLGFAQRISINGRNYRRRSEIEAFKDRMVREAIARAEAERPDGRQRRREAVSP